MNYNSIAELYDSLEATRGRLIGNVENLTDAQASHRPTPERWTAAEIIEHLSITEHRSVRLFHKLLNRAAAAGVARFSPFSIDEFVERSRGEKFEAPEVVRPKGSAPLADSLARLAESRASLRELRPRVEATDCRELVFPHPLFGPLNLYQWLAFIGAHEERHLAQIEALKASEGFEAAGRYLKRV